MPRMGSIRVLVLLLVCVFWIATAVAATTTAGPTTTAAPTTTAGATTTAAPTTTAGPTTTAAPTTTAVPTTTAGPTTTAAPTTTAGATTTAAPTTTAGPTTTAAPTTTAVPTTTAGPTTTAAPTTTAGPTTTAAPTTTAGATTTPVGTTGTIPVTTTTTASVTGTLPATTTTAVSTTAPVYKSPLVEISWGFAPTLNVPNLLGTGKISLISTSDADPSTGAGALELTLRTVSPYGIPTPLDGNHSLAVEVSLSKSRSTAKQGVLINGFENTCTYPNISSLNSSSWSWKPLSWNNLYAFSTTGPSDIANHKRRSLYTAALYNETGVPEDSPFSSILNKNNGEYRWIHPDRETGFCDMNEWSTHFVEDELDGKRVYQLGDSFPDLGSFYELSDEWYSYYHVRYSTNVAVHENPVVGFVPLASTGTDCFFIHMDSNLAGLSLPWKIGVVDYVTGNAGNVTYKGVFYDGSKVYVEDDAATTSYDMDAGSNALVLFARDGEIAPLFHICVDRSADTISFAISDFEQNPVLLTAVAGGISDIPYTQGFTSPRPYLSLPRETATAWLFHPVPSSPERTVMCDKCSGLNYCSSSGECLEHIYSTPSDPFEYYCKCDPGYELSDCSGLTDYYVYMKVDVVDEAQYNYTNELITDLTIVQTDYSGYIDTYNLTLGLSSQTHLHSGIFHVDAIQNYFEIETQPYGFSCYFTKQGDSFGTAEPVFSSVSFPTEILLNQYGTRDAKDGFTQNLYVVLECRKIPVEIEARLTIDGKVQDLNQREVSLGAQFTILVYFYDLFNDPVVSPFEVPLQLAKVNNGSVEIDYSNWELYPVNSYTSSKTTISTAFTLVAPSYESWEEIIVRWTPLSYDTGVSLSNVLYFRDYTTNSAYASSLSEHYGVQINSTFSTSINISFVPPNPNTLMYIPQYNYLTEGYPMDPIAYQPPTDILQVAPVDTNRIASMGLGLVTEMYAASIGVSMDVYNESYPFPDSHIIPNTTVVTSNGTHLAFDSSAELLTPSPSYKYGEDSVTIEKNDFISTLLHVQIFKKFSFINITSSSGSSDTYQDDYICDSASLPCQFTKFVPSHYTDYRFLIKPDHEYGCIEVAVQNISRSIQDYFGSNAIFSLTQDPSNPCQWIVKGSTARSSSWDYASPITVDFVARDRGMNSNGDLPFQITFRRFRPLPDELVYEVTDPSGIFNYTEYATILLNNTLDVFSAAPAFFYVTGFPSTDTELEASGTYLIEPFELTRPHFPNGDVSTVTSTGVISGSAVQSEETYIVTVREPITNRRLRMYIIVLNNIPTTFAYPFRTYLVQENQENWVIRPRVRHSYEPFEVPSVTTSAMSCPFSLNGTLPSEILFNPLDGSFYANSSSSGFTGTFTITIGSDCVGGDAPQPWVYFTMTFLSVPALDVEYQYSAARFGPVFTENIYQSLTNIVTGYDEFYQVNCDPEGLFGDFRRECDDDTTTKQYQVGECNDQEYLCLDPFSGEVYGRSKKDPRLTFYSVRFNVHDSSDFQEYSTWGYYPHNYVYLDILISETLSTGSVSFPKDLYKSSVEKEIYEYEIMPVVSSNLIQIESFVGAPQLPTYFSVSPNTGSILLPTVGVDIETRVEAITLSVQDAGSSSSLKIKTQLEMLSTLTDVQYKVPPELQKYSADPNVIIWTANTDITLEWLPSVVAGESHSWSFLGQTAGVGYPNGLKLDQVTGKLYGRPQFKGVTYDEVTEKFTLDNNGSDCDFYGRPMINDTLQFGHMPPEFTTIAGIYGNAQQYTTTIRAYDFGDTTNYQDTSFSIILIDKLSVLPTQYIFCPEITSTPIGYDPLANQITTGCQKELVSLESAVDDTLAELIFELGVPIQNFSFFVDGMASSWEINHDASAFGSAINWMEIDVETGEVYGTPSQTTRQIFHYGLDDEDGFPIPDIPGVKDEVKILAHDLGSSQTSQFSFIVQVDAVCDESILDPTVCSDLFREYCDPKKNMENNVCGKCLPGYRVKNPELLDQWGKPCEKIDDPTVLAIVLGTSVLLVAIVIFLLSRKYPNAKHSVIFVSALSFYDLITDMLLCVYVNEVTSLDETDIEYLPIRPVFYVQVSFLIIPFVVNCVAMAKLILNELDDPAFRIWFDKNTAGAACVMLLSSTNVGVLKVFTSKMFDADLCNAPVSKKADRLIDVAGLITNVFEDIPQFVVQCIVVYHTGLASLDNIVWASLFASILALLFGITHRAVQCCLFLTGSGEDEEQFDAGRQQKHGSIMATHVDFDQYQDGNGDTHGDAEAGTQQIEMVEQDPGNENAGDKPADVVPVDANVEAAEPVADLEKNPVAEPIAAEVAPVEENHVAEVAEPIAEVAVPAEENHVPAEPIAEVAGPVEESMDVNF